MLSATWWPGKAATLVSCPAQTSSANGCNLKRKAKRPDDLPLKIQPSPNRRYRQGLSLLDGSGDLRTGIGANLRKASKASASASARLINERNRLICTITSGFPDPATNPSPRWNWQFSQLRGPHDACSLCCRMSALGSPISLLIRKTRAIMKSKPETMSRTVLPIPDRPFTGPVMFDAKDPNSKFPPIEPLRPPKGAPNVLLVLLDDAGFAAMNTFGGPCTTPNADRLAAGGLTFNRFHVCALCAPTRQALLTGRNHHSVGMGNITEAATSAPGMSGIRPKNCAPLAQILKLNGYSTAQIGKCHEVPVWETSEMGPFDGWPTGGGGFEHFYGFFGAETDYYRPDLYKGTTPIEPPKTPEEGYIFDADIADHAIEWMRQQKALMPDKPFFIYFAPGGTHAPHAVPAEWSDKYKGKFDQGWDKLREDIFARQKKLGVIPADAELTERPKEIPAWKDVADNLKPVLARQMEVYAGYMEHTDFQVGRVLHVSSVDFHL